MSPPVSNAIQGAYFVAIFVTGLIFAAGSLVFQEVTEGLGCILGGYCLAMWLLTLKAGGTIMSEGGKAIFIAIFAVVAWSMSFSHYTRPYGIIGSTSFSGATAIVLGIDCFSRAGYKEFWLYIWNLNDNLFPLNTTTYPITRGMKVEIAVVVLLTILGIISQLKIWKVIQERREKKNAIRLEEEKRRSAMDETIGRYLETRNARERGKWERIYGQRDPSNANSGIDSGIGSEASSGKGTSSVREVALEEGLTPTEEIQMRHLSVPRVEQGAFSKLKRQSNIIVQPIEEEEEPSHELSDVSQGHTAPASEAGEHVSTSAPSESGSTSTKSVTPLQSPRSTTPPAPPTPAIVPLPFTIPGARTKTQSLTPAAAIKPMDAGKDSKRASKRFSGQSFLKRFSTAGMRDSLVSASAEDLMFPSFHHSRASSIAATVNEDDFDTRSINPGQGGVPELPDVAAMPTNAPPVSDDEAPELPEIQFNDQPLTPSAIELQEDADPEEFARPAMTNPEPPYRPSLDKGKSVMDKPEQAVDVAARASDDLPVGASAEAATTTAPAGPLTRGALDKVPSQLSNVVMTFRTNEWAKHIADADGPTHDRMSVILNGAELESPARLAEEVVPVKVDELEQTATNPRIAPLERRASATTAPLPAHVERSLSSTSKPPRPHIIPLPSQSSVSVVPQPARLQRSSSQQSIANNPSIVVSRPGSALAQNRGMRSSSTPQLNQALMTSPIDENAEMQFSTPPTSPLVTGPPSVARRDSADSQVLNRSSSGLNTNGQQLKRASSGLSMTNQQQPIRSASQLNFTRPDSRTSIYQTPGQLTRSDTRLSTYLDSHQPERSGPSNFVPGKWETMLADWRGSMRQEVNQAVDPAVAVEQRRQELLFDKHQSQISKQQHEANKQYKDKVLDRAMRGSDMQALHREKMREMQAKANKHI